MPLQSLSNRGAITPLLSGPGVANAKPSVTIQAAPLPVTKAIASLSTGTATRGALVDSPRAQAAISAPSPGPRAQVQPNGYAVIPGPSQATPYYKGGGGGGASPATGPTGPSYGTPAMPPTSSDPATTYVSDGNKAQYNDPNLPPQSAIPDDSHAWNDPAPVAVVADAIEAHKAASNPRILSSTAMVLAPKPTLWTRILTFLGFIKAPTATTSSATVHGEPSIKKVAESLVRRINNGDQNAMGLAVMIGDNARKGNARAQETFRHMEAFIKRTSPGATHAGESRRDINPGWAHAVSLANGPLLHDGKIADVAASFGAESDAKAFISGILLPTHPAVSAAHHHGKVLGMARKLQAVRMPNSRISDYSATVGWELGE